MIPITEIVTQPKLFISYAHADGESSVKNFWNNLKAFLTRPGLKWDNWSDKQILVGADWDKTISEALEQKCNCCLLLVSDLFANSSYILDKEWLTTLARHKEQGIVFFPVVLGVLEGGLRALPEELTHFQVYWPTVSDLYVVPPANVLHPDQIRLCYKDVQEQDATRERFLSRLASQMNAHFDEYLHDQAIKTSSVSSAIPNVNANIVPTASPLPATVKRTNKLYGRETLLKEVANSLRTQPFLLIYGLRGNGKTAFIEALGAAAPLCGKEHVRIFVDPNTTPEYLFRQIASLLGETSELPKPPKGDSKTIAAKVRSSYPNPRPAWIWIDSAHHLLDSNGIRNVEIRNLLAGLQAALGMQWHWVFELRERPPLGLFGELASACEVPGLDKESLRQCLAEAAPAGLKADWTYSGDQLKRIYQWLGGGHGKQAHPQAIHLLIEVACGRSESPREVLDRHIGDFEQKVEDVLMGDLYINVLSIAEQQLIQALALYRTIIPHDHAERLEQDLLIPGAWVGLDRRCLLTANADHSQYYLHSFIAGWLRTRQLGYAGHGENNEADFAETTDDDARQHARNLHSAIAGCWLEQLGVSRRATNLNMTRALEAFHHLAAAGDSSRMHYIAVEFLTGNLEWAKERMKALCDYRFRTNAPNILLLQGLEYRAVLDPDDHTVQRFLGECWAREEGKGSAKALRCFEEACRLRHDYPIYWANLGRTLLAQGEAGAYDFLQRLAELEQYYPQAINDHVRSIQSDCFRKVGATSQTATLRMEKINAGSRNAVFYNDEAKARLDAGDTAGALEILDMADKNCPANEYTAATRASVLQKTDPKKAASLRMERINAGSRNAAFYNDEANSRLDAGDMEGALEILDKADKSCPANEYIAATRASVLQKTDPKKAAALRMEKINAGSHNAAFYNDEANARLDAGDMDGALEILDKAIQKGAADEFTIAIRARVLQKTDPKKAAALRMERINAESHNVAFYNDEANARLDAGDMEGALEILDKAMQKGAADEFTAAIRASVSVG